MAQWIREYVEGLSQAVGEAWNRWWYAPRDPMPLSALRVAIGLITLYWLATLGADLVLLYGEGGLLPAEIVAGRPPSYLTWLRTPAELWVAHGIALVVTCLFTIGFFTRINCVLTLIAFLAYLHRGPMITGLVEPVLAFALFYLCFAPSGAYLSIDAWLRGTTQRLSATGDSRPAPSIAANVVARLLQLHVALVYLMMGLTMLSSPERTWWFGEAMWYLIARPESRMVDLTWLHDNVYVLNFWTHWIVFYELAFAAFIWNRWARPLLLLAGVPHWMLLALVSGHAPFCLAMLALNLAYLPSRGDARPPAAS